MCSRLLTVNRLLQTPVLQYPGFRSAHSSNAILWAGVRFKRTAGVSINTLRILQTYGDNRRNLSRLSNSQEQYVDMLYSWPQRYKCAIQAHQLKQNRKANYRIYFRCGSQGQFTVKLLKCFWRKYRVSGSAFACPTGVRIILHKRVCRYWNMNIEIWILKHEYWNMKIETWILIYEYWNMNIETFTNISVSSKNTASHRVTTKIRGKDIILSWYARRTRVVKPTGINKKL